MQSQDCTLRRKGGERETEEDTSSDEIKLDFQPVEDPIVFVSPTGSSG